MADVFPRRGRADTVVQWGAGRVDQLVEQGGPCCPPLVVGETVRRIQQLRELLAQLLSNVTGHEASAGERLAEDASAS